MTTLKQAIKDLTSSYGDIRAEARQYQFGMAEVLNEISKVEADSAEGVVLNLLLESAVSDGEKAVKKSTKSTE